MKSQLLRKMLRCGALLGAVSCAPQGELQRTLHPPNKKFTDKREDSSGASSPAGRAPSMADIEAQKGLPEVCSRVDAPDSPLCIACKTEGVLLLRCYDYAGNTDLNQDCVYTPDRLKCLAKNPPYALTLGWRAPEEKYLRDNFLVWQDAVHTIWDPKLSPAEKAESDAILKNLDLATRVLTTSTVTTDADIKTFADQMPGRGLDSAKQSRELFASLQRARTSGHLNLKLVLDHVGAYYERTHGHSKLWAELRTMSLQGLDEAN